MYILNPHNPPDPHKSQCYLAREEPKMDNAHYVSLHAQAVDLSKTYFIGVTHAPAVYLTLGKSLDSVAFALERLCLELSHPNSR